MSDDLHDASQELGEFFSTIWGDTVGYVYLPIKDVATDKWRKLMFKWPEAKNEVVQHVLVSSAANNEVYFAPALFKEVRPLKENVLGSRVVWADFDGNAPEGTLRPATPSPGTDTPTDTEGPGEGQDGPVAAIPEPSIRVQSSTEGHQHLYWILNEFLNDVSKIDNINRSIAYELNADTSGWDANQILRPPYTHNHKRGMEVRIREMEPVSYSLDTFNELKPPERLVSEQIDVSDLPAIDGIIAKYQWSEEMFELFKKPKIEQGDRSSAIMQMAYFCCEVGMTDVEAYAILIHADDRWGKFKLRSDRKERLLDAVNKARIKHPRALGDYTFAGLTGSGPVEEGRKFVYGFNELLESEIKIEWAIENLVEMQGIGMATGLPSVGKTQWSLRLAIACALGKAWLHYKPTKKMKVMFWSLEMNHPAIKSFLETMAKSLTADEIQTLEQNFKIVPLGEVVALDTKEGQAFMNNLIEEYKPDGVFIDSMGKVTYSELTDEKKIKELNGYYAALRSKYGPFLWFVHHQRKANGDNKKPKNLADLYGNQYIAAEASVVINLWLEEDESIEVSAIKTRLMARPRPYHISRTSDLQFHVKEEEILDAPLVKEGGTSDTNVNGRAGGPGFTAGL